MATRRRCILSVLLLLLFAGCSSPAIRRQQVLVAPILGGAAQKHYVLYLPPGYDAPENAHRRWPVLVYLRGMPLVGTSLRDMTQSGPPQFIEEGMDIPFVVISPHASRRRELWREQEVHDVLDYALPQLRVDLDRVCLTGISVGAEGVWRVAAARPDRFAAIAPICGWGHPDDARAIPHIPVWSFHGALDFVCLPHYDCEAVRAHRQAGGDCRYTIYPFRTHFIWDMVYARRDFYQWLLCQRRPVPNAR